MPARQQDVLGRSVVVSALERAATSTTRLPRGLLEWRSVGPLILAVLPIVLWMSVPEVGGTKETPIWLAVPEPVAFVMDPFYLASLVLIGVVATVMICVEASRSAYSLHLVHWIFVYIFFFSAPLVQYRIGIFPWSRLTSLETGTLLAANLAILLWSAAWISARLAQASLLSRRPVPLGPSVTRLGVWIVLFLAVVAALYLAATLGPSGLLTRGGRGEAVGGTELDISSSQLILDKLFRGFPVAAAAGALWLWRSGRDSSLLRLLLVVVSFGLLLVADFPLGSARYWAGSVYIGLLLTLFGWRLRDGWPVVLALVGGLLVVFPFLSALRYATSLQEVLSYLNGFSFLGPSLATGDFDAYSMVGYTIEYAREGPGATHGLQLLGVVLFFVPRSLWPDKPFGSGYEVAVQGQFPFYVVSSSPVAEGFVNFGWVGIVLFAVALSWAFGLADASFRRAADEGRGTVLRLAYPFWIGFAFFLIRGDLLSVVALAVPFAISFLPLAARVRKLRL